ncbi:MAG: solute-binding transporter (periplasmic) [Candidatus Tectimicrobiota bacterium]|nr:MAG: solute-binding transporter (periplasmic) [Candidatus Tectomicrobia bacterium]
MAYGPEVSRRQFIKMAGTAAVAAGLGSQALVSSALGAQDAGLVPYPDMFYANRPKAWTEKDIRRGGELVFAHVSDPPHLNPLLTTSYSMLAATGPVYSRLIRPKGGDYDDPFNPELVPDLAESWEISNQGKTLTFKLRRGVRWHNKPPVNGREFTSEDVRATIEGWSKGATAYLAAPVERIETPSKYQVVIHLKDPDVAFFRNLASSWSHILPKEAVEGAFDAKTTAIGTGPFILTEYTRKTEYKYERNPDYFIDGLPYLDRYVLRIIPEEASRIAALRTGQVDGIKNLGSKETVDLILRTNPKVVVQQLVQPFSIFHVAMPYDTPPWNDVRVRRAVSLALNREEMNDLVYAGVGHAYTNGIPWFALFDRYPGREAYGPWFEYNPDKARELLRQAGVKNLTVELIFYRYGSYVDESVDLITQYLAEVGITVKPRSLEYGVWIDHFLGAKYEGLAFGFTVPAGGMDPLNDWAGMLQTGHPKNSWRVSDPELDRLLVAQRRELDATKRREIAKQIWERTNDQVYRAHVPRGTTFFAYQPWVKNYRASNGYYSTELTFGSWQVLHIWLDDKTKYA